MGRQTAVDFDLGTIDHGFIENPFPILNLLRQHDPVHWNSDGSVYLTRYRDVRAVYQDKTMSSDKVVAYRQKFGEGPLYTHHTTSLIFNDPPYHTTVRKLLSSAFTPRKLTELEPLIGDIVERLLDRLEDLGDFDFISAFAMQLPTELISFMLGVPQKHRHKLRDYSIAILGALDPVTPDEKLKKGNQAVEEFSELLNDLVNHRRANPEGGGQGEILEALIFGEHDGRRLTQKELVQNCIFLLNAGHETTTSLVGNSMGILLENPEELLRLQQNPDLIDTAIEEFLRYQSPLQIGNRLAKHDVELSGVKIPAGTYIHTSIGAANRDPDIFDNPDTVDIGRSPNRPSGLHYRHSCVPGRKPLPALEGRIAIGKLAQRFPKIRTAGKPEIMDLARFRG